MKKFVVIFLIVIVFSILLGVLFFKIHPSTPKYSSEDIYALIKKGFETINNMENVCIERITENTHTSKHYYKGNKLKILFAEDPEFSFDYIIINFDEKKQYGVSDKKKILVIAEQSPYINKDKQPQSQVFQIITANKTELAYIKDEIIDQKDCIFVKEIIDDDHFYPNGVRAYWIEKSTGFILGGALIKPTQTSATPTTWIKNITFNEVVDSDFNLPSDYTVYDRSN